MLAALNHPPTFCCSPDALSGYKEPWLFAYGGQFCVRTWISGSDFRPQGPSDVLQLVLTKSCPYLDHLDFGLSSRLVSALEDIRSAQPQRCCVFCFLLFNGGENRMWWMKRAVHLLTLYI